MSGVEGSMGFGGGRRVYRLVERHLAARHAKSVPDKAEKARVQIAHSLCATPVPKMVSEVSSGVDILLCCVSTEPCIGR